MKCLADLVKINMLDFIGIQETKKELIPQAFLDGVCRNFTENFIPAVGTAGGGILLGCKSSLIEVLSWQKFKFCLSVMVKIVCDKLVWKLIVVYGSPYDESKNEFVDELHMVMGDGNDPVILGGDYNLVRSQKEKSNGVVNYNHNSLFNEWIEKWGLMDC
jgi:hypothetical protein